MTHKLRIVRYETWTKDIEVDSEKTQEEVVAEIQQKLDHEGWDSVVEGDDDGDYDSCWSEAKSIRG